MNGLLMAATVAIAALALVTLAVRKYETAVFLAVLSPWVSAVFVPNIADLSVLEETTLGSYLRIGVIALVGGAGVLFCILNRRRSPAAFPFHSLLFCGYVILAVISSFYSLDPRYTAIRSATLTLFFFFLLGLHQWLSFPEHRPRLLQSIFFACLFCTLINVLSPVFAPEKAWSVEAGNRFQGLWGHPNQMGAFLMICYPVFYWRWKRSSLRGRFGIAALTLPMVFFHVLTGSRTSMLTAILGFSVWFLVQRKGLRLTLVAAAMGLALLLVLILRPPILYRETDRSVVGLTGRPEIWAAALTLAAEKPFRGYGYEVGGKIFEDPRFYDKNLGLWIGSARVSLHNGYLAVLIGVGVPGLLLFLAALLWPFLRYRRVPPTDEKALVFSVLAMGLIANTTESIVGSPAAVTSVILWMLWALAGRQVTDARNDRPASKGPLAESASRGFSR